MEVLLPGVFMRILIAWAFVLLLSSPKASAQRTIDLTSPDNNLQFQFQLFEGIAIYSIAYKKNIIVDQSAIGLTFTQGSFNDQLKSGRPQRRQGEESYELVVGKVKSVKERFN
jgi:alpha-glucosidase